MLILKRLVFFYSSIITPIESSNKRFKNFRYGDYGIRIIMTESCRMMKMVVLDDMLGITASPLIRL